MVSTPARPPLYSLIGVVAFGLLRLPVPSPVVVDGLAALAVVYPFGPSRLPFAFLVLCLAEASPGTFLFPWIFASGLSLWLLVFLLPTRV